MAQPFFVWAQHDRFPIARGYLFGSDPHECFVDNFLTWAEPVASTRSRSRSASRPRRSRPGEVTPLRKPAARKRRRERVTVL